MIVAMVLTKTATVMKKSHSSRNSEFKERIRKTNSKWIATMENKIHLNKKRSKYEQVRVMRKNARVTQTVRKMKTMMMIVRMKRRNSELYLYVLLH